MNTFLPKNDLQLKEAFAYISSIEGSSDHIKKVLSLIQNDNLDKENFDKVLGEYNIAHVEGIKPEVLDMLLAYIDFILRDNVITDSEAANFKLLKKFFKIKEGDFYKYRHANIENLLDRQFERIYADNRIDNEEALYKVGLQELFDLSYDQFLELVNKEVTSALKRGANPDELDTVLMKVYQAKNKSRERK